MNIGQQAACSSFMEKRNINIYVIIVLLTTFAVTISFFIFVYLARIDPISSKAELLVGKKVNFDLFETLGKQNESISEFKAKKVWLVYMISSCDACKNELQMISKLRDQLDQQISFVGVMVEDESSIQKYISINKVDFPVLRDKNGAFMKEMNLRYFPSNLIVEAEIVKSAFFGKPNNEEDFLKIAGF